MLDLKPSYLTIIRQILAKHVPDMTVLAYGSRVTGQAHAASDLDLIVIDPNDHKIPLRNLVELKNAFDESSLPILVDVLDWARIPASFQEEIKKHYIIIWDKDHAQL